MTPIDQARLHLLHRYWNAANYLTIGQIYLQANPLLRVPLRPEHIKPRLLGHIPRAQFHLYSPQSADPGS